MPTYNDDDAYGNNPYKDEVGPEETKYREDVERLNRKYGMGGGVTGSSPSYDVPTDVTGSTSTRGSKFDKFKGRASGTNPNYWDERGRETELAEQISSQQEDIATGSSIVSERVERATNNDYTGRYDTDLSAGNFSKEGERLDSEGKVIFDEDDIRRLSAGGSSLQSKVDALRGIERNIAAGTTFGGVEIPTDYLGLDLANTVAELLEDTDENLVRQVAGQLRNRQNNITNAQTKANDLKVAGTAESASRRAERKRQASVGETPSIDDTYSAAEAKMRAGASIPDDVTGSTTNIPFQSNEAALREYQIREVDRKNLAWGKESLTASKLDAGRATEFEVTGVSTGVPISDFREGRNSRIRGNIILSLDKPSFFSATGEGVGDKKVTDSSRIYANFTGGLEIVGQPSVSIGLGSIASTYTSRVSTMHTGVRQATYEILGSGTGRERLREMIALEQLESDATGFGIDLYGNKSLPYSERMDIATKDYMGRLAEYNTGMSVANAIAEGLTAETSQVLANELGRPERFGQSLGFEPRDEQEHFAGFEVASRPYPPKVPRVEYNLDVLSSMNKEIEGVRATINPRVDARPVFDVTGKEAGTPISTGSLASPDDYKIAWGMLMNTQARYESTAIGGGKLLDVGLSEDDISWMGTIARYHFPKDTTDEMREASFNRVYRQFLNPRTNLDRVLGGLEGTLLPSITFKPPKDSTETWLEFNAARIERSTITGRNVQASGTTVGNERTGGRFVQSFADDNPAGELRNILAETPTIPSGVSDVSFKSTEGSRSVATGDRSVYGDVDVSEQSQVIQISVENNISIEEAIEVVGGIRGEAVRIEGGVLTDVEASQLPANTFMEHDGQIVNSTDVTTARSSALALNNLSNAPDSIYGTSLTVIREGREGKQQELIPIKVQGVAHVPDPVLEAYFLRDLEQARWDKENPQGFGVGISSDGRLEFTGIRPTSDVDRRLEFATRIIGNEPMNIPSRNQQFTRYDSEGNLLGKVVGGVPTFEHGRRTITLSGISAPERTTLIPDLRTKEDVLVDRVHATNNPPKPLTQYELYMDLLKAEPEDNSKEWFESRFDTFTASLTPRISGVLNLRRHKKANFERKMWERVKQVGSEMAMLREGYDPFKGTLATRMGTESEESTLEAFTSQKQFGAFKFAKGAFITDSKNYEGIGATPDMMMFNNDGSLHAVVEAKSLSGQDAVDAALKGKYEWQVQAQMLATGAKYGYLTISDISLPLKDRVSQYIRYTVDPYKQGQIASFGRLASLVSKGISPEHAKILEAEDRQRRKEDREMDIGGLGRGTTAGASGDRGAFVEPQPQVDARPFGDNRNQEDLFDGDSPSGDALLGAVLSRIQQDDDFVRSNVDKEDTLARDIKEKAEDLITNDKFKIAVNERLKELGREDLMKGGARTVTPPRTIRQEAIDKVKRDDRTKKVKDLADNMTGQDVRDESDRIAREQLTQLKESNRQSKQNRRVLKSINRGVDAAVSRLTEGLEGNMDDVRLTKEMGLGDKDVSMVRGVRQMLSKKGGLEDRDTVRVLQTLGDLSSTLNTADKAAAWIDDMSPMLSMLGIPTTAFGSFEEMKNLSGIDFARILTTGISASDTNLSTLFKRMGVAPLLTAVTKDVTAESFNATQEINPVTSRLGWEGYQNTMMGMQNFKSRWAPTTVSGGEVVGGLQIALDKSLNIKEAAVTITAVAAVKIADALEGNMGITEGKSPIMFQEHRNAIREMDENIRARHNIVPNKDIQQPATAVDNSQSSININNGLKVDVNVIDKTVDVMSNEGMKVLDQSRTRYSNYG